MIPDETFFQERYALLNPSQKEAVDTLSGPVMVIAGPGTGKTEVLAMRIANLLRSEIQVNPYEILCLTFTEEAVQAMRARLVQIIGQDAYRVNIFTFHGFCNRIIQGNQEYFGTRDLQPVSDLQRTELLYALIESLPAGHLLRRLKGNIYNDVQHLRQLFDLMKSEHWTAERVSSAIDEYLLSLRDHPDYIYKVGNSKKNIRKGDFKQDLFNKESERMERTRAAALLLPAYGERMREAGWYDFQDMILWVIRAFRQHPDFLLLNQERFQHMLVDEFQDTSGAQQELLQLLCDYWEDPSIFIVGDDDQSIFEFQGARLQNIVDFHERYQASVRTIVLTQNYRSAQPVLDAAGASIVNNNQRLISRLGHLGITKDIVSSNPRFAEGAYPRPVLYACFNQLHEEGFVADELERIYCEGGDLSHCAVLYAQHRQAANIIGLLEKRGIPYSVRRAVNVLDLPLVRQVLHVFEYLAAESRIPLSGEELLFRILHSPFFGVDPLDIAACSLYMQSKDARHRKWRYLLQDPLFLETFGLRNATAMHRLGTHLEGWIARMSALSLPMLAEKILYEGGITGYAMQGGSPVWDLQVLRTLFESACEESSANPRITVAVWLDMLRRMDREKIPMPVLKVVQQENGVQFYTAFSAKGHEFEKVFLVGLTSNFWEDKSGMARGFKLPESLTLTATSDSGPSETEEVARRLFYVALTRAKKDLYLSYGRRDDKDKPLQPSLYLEEIKTLIEPGEFALSEAEVLGQIAERLSPVPAGGLRLADEKLLRSRLEQFTMSASALNQYLYCPVAFYYENILRAPEMKSDALAFGVAVHYALQQLFEKMTKLPGHPFPPLDDILRLFKFDMRRREEFFTKVQYERRLELGEKILTDYYADRLQGAHRIVRTEFNIMQASLGKIPIKGKIDKLEFFDNNVVIVDYKTGNPEYARRKLSAPSEAEPLGGDYWRQMVFYKILLGQFGPARGWSAQYGVFDFVEKNAKGEYQQFRIPLLPEYRRMVEEQIADAYGRIMNREFSRGCGKADCRWCTFVQEYGLANAEAIQ